VKGSGAIRLRGARIDALFKQVTYGLHVLISSRLYEWRDESLRTYRREPAQQGQG